MIFIRDKQTRTTRVVIEGAGHGLFLKPIKLSPLKGHLLQKANSDRWLMGILRT